MRRVHLFRGEAIEVRVHLFEDPSETLIHNHGTSFYSSCLAGCYEHRLWHAVGHSPECHFRFNRTQDPELQNPERAQGYLEAGLVHSHEPGQTYFISANTPHTVKAKR